jgi:hypothetical protein
MVYAHRRAIAEEIATAIARVVGGVKLMPHPAWLVLGCTGAPLADPIKRKRTT